MNQNNILIFDYSVELLNELQGYPIIARLSNYNNILDTFYRCKEKNNFFALWLDLPYTSLTQIPFEDNWENIPFIVYVYNIGNLNKFFNELQLIQRLNIRVFLPASNSETVRSLKILSSLGIDCGVVFDGKISDESFLDLASYFFMSPIPHASIEPFDFIWRNINQEKNIDFSTVFFENPEKYLFVDADLNVSFTKEGQQCPICKLHDFENQQYDLTVEYKLKNYYSHFSNLDNCSKCPAFKICNRKMQNIFTDCCSVFSEIYEYAEIKDQIENNNNSNKEICQL